MKYFIILSCYLLTVACNQPRKKTNDIVNNIDSASTVVDTAVHNMKGFELYVWEKNGQLYYNMLPGTNRLKTEAEIRDSTTAISQLNVVNTKIDSLAAGEFLSIKITGVDTLRLQKLLQFARAKGLEVHVESVL